MTLRNSIPLFAICAIAAFILACTASVYAAGSDDLAALFSPSFSHSGVKVAEAGNSRLLLTISTDGLLLPSTAREFTEELRKRGVSIYGPTFFGDFSWDRAAYDAAVTLIRRSRDLPDTVEVSESVIRTPDRRPIVALTVTEDKVLIALREDFGKAWRRVVIFPDKEPETAEPRTGRFPGSRLRQVAKAGGSERRFYACKGDLADAIRFFEAELGRVHKTVLMQGDPAGLSAQTVVFGIRTYGKVVTLTGHTLIDQRLSTTEVVLRKPDEPSLGPYLEIETAEY